MITRSLSRDEASSVLQALVESKIAPRPLCERAVEASLLIPFHHTLPPVGRGVRPLIAYFALRSRASGITLGRQIYIRRQFFAQIGGVPLFLIAHEVAHVVQFMRDGTLAFLIDYVGQYLKNRLQGMPDRQAYLAISHEVEARRVETFLQSDSPPENVVDLSSRLPDR